MRKISFAFLTALFLCLCIGLSACGGNNDPNNSTGGGNATYYTVSFDPQGGSAVESQRVLAGNPVRTPSTPTNGELLFQGWFASSDASAEQWNFETGRVSGDMTLFAHWAADTSEPTASITYEKTADGAGYIVTGAGQEAKIVIPETYDNLPVVEIGESAFAYSKHKSDIVSVTIPDNVTKIGLNAFYNQDALETVNIGTNSKLASIENNAFSGNSALKGFYLPAGATSLGDSVFNNCGSLNSFTVASGNTAYSGEENNLIDRASNTIVRGTNNSKIPSTVTGIGVAAFRRANAITKLYIPRSVTSIEKYAFAYSTITTIEYEGSEDDWEAVSKGAMWDLRCTLEIKYNVEQDEATKNILVAYFSRADENYSVGVIEKGNTEILAEMIQEEMGGDLFHIERDTPYPSVYSECTAVAQQEKNNNARPTLKETVDISEYDVIFFGYPIWYGDMPMCVYTFLESQDWNGKTVCPFSTNEGSGLAGTVATLKTKCAGASVSDGLAMRGSTAQNNRTEAKNLVTEWLEKIK